MAPDARDTERFSRWITQPQSLIALSAVLLSVCGLFIAVYEAALIRRAQRASVWPHIEVGASLTKRRVEIRVQNVGVGPAKVEAAALQREGRTLRDWAELWSAADLDPENANYYFSVIQSRVLPRDSESETIFRLTAETGPEAPELIALLRREVYLGTIDVSLCYCSVYDECWVSSLRDVMARSREAGNVDQDRRTDSCDSAPRSLI